MKIISRSEWGAAPPKWDAGVVNPSLGMFIHYNGPEVSKAVLAGDYESVAAFLRSTQRYHMQSNGWPDIAYSFCVDSMGRIWELRGWGKAGAHTLDWNWKSHAIFLSLGGNQAPTDAQINSCKSLIAEHDRRYGKGFVKGHQQAPNQTSCPGPVVLGLINSGAFNPTTAPVPVPPGVDIKMNKPVMMLIGTKVWMFYENTPFRIHVQTPADVQTYEFFGVELKKVDAKSGEFFIRNSQEVKCG